MLIKFPYDLQKYRLAINGRFKLLKLLYYSSDLPILIYQIGKVGSTSISKSLELNGYWAVFHIHRLNPEHIDHVKENFLARNLQPSSGRLGKLLHRHIIEKKRQIKVISLIRDPINRNISSFFENKENHLPKASLKHYDFEIYAKTFLEKYPHHVPLEWFDKEPRVTLGIDIFQIPFPKKTGYLEIKRENINWLILKSELDNDSKENAINEFLDLDSFTIINANITMDKPYAEAYQHFKNALQLPKWYIDKMRNAKYSQHFYSTDELQSLWSRWL